MATMAGEGEWSILVIFNDGGYGVLRNLQEAHSGERHGVDLHHALRLVHLRELHPLGQVVHDALQVLDTVSTCLHGIVAKVFVLAAGIINVDLRSKPKALVFHFFHGQLVQGSHFSLMKISQTKNA